MSNMCLRTCPVNPWERCILGATQTQNVSFNFTIWNRCSNTEFCSPEVVEIALNFDVLTFNSGHLALRPLLVQLGCYCGPLTHQFLSQCDINQVWLAEYKADQLVKKRRQALQYNIVELEEQSINCVYLLCSSMH